MAVGQLSHAWISGQLARAWGNERFGLVEPFEEVCLAAEQHDIGMGEWDLSPTLNPDTGLPHSFTEMPLGVHLELWSSGPRRLLRQSRYATLLAAMHGRRLYEARDLGNMPVEEADAVRRFIHGQRRFEEELLAALRADPATAALAEGPMVQRNSQLLWTWDLLSLAVCLDWAPRTARAVPTAGQPVDVSIAPGRHPLQVTAEPWPFRRPAVTVRCEGQRLRDRYRSEPELREALARCAWETIEFELVER